MADLQIFSTTGHRIGLAGRTVAAARLASTALSTRPPQTLTTPGLIIHRLSA
jgi:hypothetical protein